MYLFCITFRQTAMKIIKIINNTIRILERPVLRELPFFVWIIFLLIFPTLVNAYWINGKEMSFSYIQQTNRFGAAIPYVLFMPFVIAYLFVVIQFFLGKNFFKLVIYCILTILMFLNLFLLLNFSTMVSPMMFTLLSETTSQESSGFISTYIFSKGTFLAFGLCIVVTALIWLTEKFSSYLYNCLSNKSVIRFSVIWVMAYLFLRGVPCFSYYLSLFSCKTPEDVEEWSHSFKYETNTVSVIVYSYYDYLSQKYEVARFYDMMSSVNNDSISSDVDSVDVVFVIGESYNKYHAGIYDYLLDTTPFMTEQAEKGHLIVFDNAVSPYNMTSFVIKNMLSTNSISDHERWSEYPFFPVLFRNAGFSVYFWDNQMVLSGGDVSDFSLNALIHNSEISSLSYTAVNDKTFQYDGDLITDFSERVRLTNGRNLTIFHLQGQHFEAKDKYPHGCGFDVFSADSYHNPQLSKGMLQEVACYDNATRYNDYVIRQISNMFKDRRAVLVYVSDHGEEVYDYRQFIGRTHEENKTGDALKYQYDVPFVIWFSEKYMSENAEVVEALRRNTHKRILTDDISHLLLGLGCIKSSYYNPTRDLSSDGYREKRRIVQNTIDYDRRMSGK